MPSSGEPFNQTVILQASPEETIQRLLGSTAGTRDHTFNMAGPNSLVITRRYIPTWAVIAAVVGVLLFLIGLLALLYRETEVLTITATEVPGGTRVTLNGMATAELVARLNAVFQADQQVAAGGPEPSRAPAALPAPSSGKTCPNGHPLHGDEAFCGECGSPASRWCENGHPVSAMQRFCPECGAAASDNADPVRSRHASRSAARPTVAKATPTSKGTRETREAPNERSASPSAPEETE